MEQIINYLANCARSAIQFIITGIISAFMPMQDALFILLLGFTINFITGYVTDLRVNDKDFSIKKAFNSVSQLGYFFGLIFFISAIGKYNSDSAFSQLGVKWSTIIVSYFYVINILKNGRQIWPGNIAINFLYDFLSFQGINYLRKLFNLKKKGK